MAEGPIQIVLNADHFLGDRERPKGRGRESDFFVGQDAEFLAHKESLKTQLAAAAHSMEQYPYAKVGFAKFTLRRSKWAKSHRPTTCLLPQENHIQRFSFCFVNISPVYKRVGDPS